MNPLGKDLPSKVLVVGAGIVGLSCAWALQEYGVEVEVADRHRPAAGASWGNAGFVSPALTLPLPEPSILRFGLRAVLDPRSPVALPLPAGREVLTFLASMARYCTAAKWTEALAIYRPLNDRIFEAFDRQHAGGLGAATVEAETLAAFEHIKQAEGILSELRAVAAGGGAVEVDLLTGDQARQREPHLSPAISAAAVIHGQRYLTPAPYVAALADLVERRGGKILEDTEITSVRREGRSVIAESGEARLEADAVILASGSWISSLARPHGVRVPVQAGRGYSFSVAAAEPLSSPLYLPATRVAITPDGQRVRFAGVMEFARPDRAMLRSRIPSMVRALRPLLQGLDLDSRADEWVGARPLTADGVPLVGATRTPGVFMAGGHGMWGVTLGPLTGQLLAEQIMTGRTPPELAPLDPLR